MNTNNNANLTKLWTDFKRFIEFEIDYVKLTATEKLTIILSSIAVVAIMIILGGMALFYLSFALAYQLESWTGNMTISYLIISGVILLILFVIYILRKKLILDPVAKFISKLFLDPPKK